MTSRKLRPAPPEKPLFVPLTGEWFDKFKSGEKHIEYRAYGPRWNHGTCYTGRRVTLSRGYGKAHRLERVIEAVTVLTINRAPAAALTIYPKAKAIIAIHLGAVK